MRFGFFVDALGLGRPTALLVLWQVSALYWVSSTNWPPVTDIARAMVTEFGLGATVSKLC